mmetsp:Transcript_66950/g.157949  ORF Transcript_66950/g.157949 Transcript_66950/m.157949 type:complete len:273 (+) Transcript_66950:1110-1928(+)
MALIPHRHRSKLQPERKTCWSRLPTLHFLPRLMPPHTPYNGVCRPSHHEQLSHLCNAPVSRPNQVAPNQPLHQRRCHLSPVLLDTAEKRHRLCVSPLCLHALHLTQCRSQSREPSWRRQPAKVPCIRTLLKHDAGAVFETISFVFHRGDAHQVAAIHTLYRRNRPASLLPRMQCPPNLPRSHQFRVPRWLEGADACDRLPFSETNIGVDLAPPTPLLVLLQQQCLQLAAQCTRFEERRGGGTRCGVERTSDAEQNHPTELGLHKPGLFLRQF